LTLLSPFATSARRAAADLALQRNRFIAALADEVVFGMLRRAEASPDCASRSEAGHKYA
jgi:hypothetical protein